MALRPTTGVTAGAAPVSVPPFRAIRTGSEFSAFSQAQGPLNTSYVIVETADRQVFMRVAAYRLSNPLQLVNFGGKENVICAGDLLTVPEKSLLYFDDTCLRGLTFNRASNAGTVRAGEFLLTVLDPEWQIKIVAEVRRMRIPATPPPRAPVPKQRTAPAQPPAPPKQPPLGRSPGVDQYGRVKGSMQPSHRPDQRTRHEGRHWSNPMRVRNEFPDRSVSALHECPRTELDLAASVEGTRLPVWRVTNRAQLAWMAQNAWTLSSTRIAPDGFVFALVNSDGDPFRPVDTLRFVPTSHVPDTPPLLPGETLVVYGTMKVRKDPSRHDITLAFKGFTDLASRHVISRLKQFLRSLPGDAVLDVGFEIEGELSSVFIDQPAGGGTTPMRSSSGLI